MRTATGRHPVPRLQRLLGVVKAFSLRFDPTGTVSLGAEIAPLTGVADSGRFADDGLDRSRWERATPAQRDLMRVVGNLRRGGPVPIADIAEAMGKRVTDLSNARRELIQKGLVYAPERGVLAVTVPGMREFIERQD